MSARASARDLSAGYVKINENELRKTGLRGKKLFTVIICLVILWILALVTLICNILLMVVLRMNHRGMESMQFMSVHDENGPDHLVQFTGQHTHLGTIIVNSGVIAGYKDQDFNLTASKIVLESKDTSPASRFTLDRRRIRVENVKNFLVTNRMSEGAMDPENGHSPSSQILFDANKPTFRLKKSIKRLATAKVITNQIKAPNGANISLSSSRSMTLHGSDNCIFEASSIRLIANRSFTFHTSDQGALKLISQTRARMTFTRAPALPISAAPAFRADKLGLRLCVCKNTGRLFSVQGNQKCRIREAYCH